MVGELLKFFKTCFILEALFFGSVLQAQESIPLTRLAQFHPYPEHDYNDCWGYTGPDGREYALLGVDHGLSIVDITDTSQIREVAFIPGPLRAIA